MKNDSSLKPGEKIELLLNRKGSSERYLSKVETVISDDTFIITRPIGDEQYMFLTLGEIVRVIFFRDDGAYYFDAKVLERIKSQESISTRMVALSDKYKLQRRNYYRLNTMVPVTLTYFENGAMVSKKMDTIDISGGGIRIATVNKMNVGMEVGVTAEIQGIEDYEIIGRVVRSMLSEKGDLYETGIEFTNIHQRIRQAIIEYIFTRQREILKKGFK